MSTSLHRTFNVFSLGCNRLKLFATSIRKWSRHLTDFPTSRFQTPNWLEDCRTVLTEIYGHPCISDMAVKTALIDTGPRPFCLQCQAPWGGLPDASNANLRRSDILIDARLHLVAGNLTSAEWLATATTRGGLRHARR